MIFKKSLLIFEKSQLIFNSINMEKLLLDFQQFYRQNSDAWIGKFDYAEAGPQLLLQAYLQRIVLELKVKRGALDTIIKKGLEQTAEYMDTVGSVDEGHLIIFDRDGGRSWDERIWHEKRSFQGRTMMVWGM